jgi:hypothetical protein
MIELLAALSFVSAAPDTVYLNVGSTFQDSITAHPAGTVYIIGTGVHRLQDVSPKSNDIYIGRAGAIMNGARLLTNWVQEGAYWAHYQQDQQGQVHGNCVDSCPGCKYPEDLYIDNAIMRHDTAKALVTAGSYYFDYANDAIYITDNPAGHVMEVCTARRAFGNTNASGVRVQGVTVEKYAIPAQMGAIGDQYPGNGWIVENCEVRFNHGTGINVTNHGVIRNCFVHRNGQKGVGAGGTGCLIEGNEIAYNLTAGFDWGWEGGGSKFANTDSLVVRNNYVHHNFGPGLWTDINNIHTLYESNTVEYNQAMGIFHEISYAATIRCNRVGHNGLGDFVWLWGAQILLAASKDVQVYHNTVTVDVLGGNGICLVQQNRGSGNQGLYYAERDSIHDNDITHLGNAGQSGAAADWDNANFWANSHSSFDYNVYHVPDSTKNRWGWADAGRNWVGFRAQGQEAHGRVDYNLSYTPDFPACSLQTRIEQPANHSHALLRQIGLRVSVYPGTQRILIESPEAMSNLALYAVSGKIVPADINMLAGGRSAVIAYNTDVAGVSFIHAMVAGRTVVSRFLMIGR